MTSASLRVSSSFLSTPGNTTVALQGDRVDHVSLQLISAQESAMYLDST
jgi:hypothetical protein